MFGLMMLIFLAWSRDERPAASGRGWLEAARRASMASLVASHPGPGTGPAGDQAAAGQPSGTQPPGARQADGQPAAGGAAATAPPPGGDWSGRGGIDDDEHLAAYNAFLARLNESEPGRRR